ncbi:MAG TPA: homocysteine biosynthesis protein [Thermotogota bacterium]|nr:homocysteine biosynthesis protein [Thermotogota bacterium]
MKTIEEINRKIAEKKAVVVRADEIAELVKEEGFANAARKVDVVTTATFSPMCSSGAFLNFGHATPGVKIAKTFLNDVEAYSGLAAVDAYIGATQPSRKQGTRYGGAHVICDLVAGKPVRLEAEGTPTDCYPGKRVSTIIHKHDINEATLFNPRNVYQNYNAATNSSSRKLLTYMGTLHPHYQNITYATSGRLSPLFVDPCLRTIGIGTRVFLGGAHGFVAWNGTQYQVGSEHSGDIPVSPARTLALIGNLKQMDCRFLRPAVIQGYGVSLFVGVGIPIPILDEEQFRLACVENDQIFTKIVDYASPDHPEVARLSYAQLRSGKAPLQGKMVRTSPLSSLKKAQEIAGVLQEQLRAGSFLLTSPVQPLPDGPEKIKSMPRMEG